MALSWYQKRTLQAFITLLTVITLTFVLIRQMPAGPMDYLAGQLMQQAAGGQSVSQEQINRLMETYTGVARNEPLYVQYFDYLVGVLQGDLGKSFLYDESVSSIIAKSLPWTTWLMTITLFVSFVGGVLTGALMAYRESTKLDVALTGIFSTLTSIPYYVTGLILLLALAYRMSVFPTGGRLPNDVEPALSLAFFGGALYHAALPILSMSLARLGGVAIDMRANSISELGRDYVRVARLRGLPERRITYRYIARNAILPMYTGLMISIGFAFGGSIILEQIFKYIGIGWYMFKAIGARDYPLMMGTFLVITVAVILGIYVADLTYGYIDPRANVGGGQYE